MAALSSSDISTLIGKIKKFPYLCSFGTDGLGPLAGAPTIAPQTETKDVTLYETEGDVEASYLTKNDLTVTVRTRDIETAMSLAASITKGANVLASSLGKALTLVPITSATEKTITFAHAFLQPGLNYTPGENGDPSVAELTFLCKADDTTGLPFAYGSTPSSSASSN